MRASCIIQLLFVAILTSCSPTTLTINWNAESCNFVGRGGYARIKAIDNHHAMAYNVGRTAVIRFSYDRCESWSKPIEVAKAEGYLYTNCELLQLQSGKLLYTWNARPLPQTALPYKIMYALSNDGGESWSKGEDLYIADTSSKNGCWEPSILQLPSGEIHIYFANEAPYTKSSEQEISLIRSYDEGKSWSKAERVSFRAGKRDGMPVPIYLPHTKEIAMAIEDNGIRGRFKPVVVRTKDNWRDGYVAGDDYRREEAIARKWAVHDSIYAGAPYLIRLGDKHTLLSIQSTEGRQGKNHKYANMQVYIGNKNARNFCNRSTPLPDLDKSGCALWNSLAQIDDNRVIAVMSIKGKEQSKNGVWTIIGNLITKRK